MLFIRDCYDTLSRLLTADYDNGSTITHYGYDLNGNMVNMDGVTRTYNTANQMTNDGVNNLTYDNNGNLQTGGYVWDRANRLLSHDGLSYAYDGLNNRVSQDNGSVVTKYLLDTQPGLTKVLRQADGTNTDHFIHAPRGIHAQYDGTNWQYIMQDGLGSVRGLIDATLGVEAVQSYDPMGVPDGSYGAGFGFTGEQTDANDMLFLRARYMNPSLGVFPSLDPYEGTMQRPMSLNGYSWVEGNPINMVDPSGMSTQCSTQGTSCCPRPERFISEFPTSPAPIDNSFVSEGLLLPFDEIFGVEFASDFEQYLANNSIQSVIASLGMSFLVRRAIETFEKANGSIPDHTKRTFLHFFEGLGTPIVNYPIEDMLNDVAPFREAIAHQLDMGIRNTLNHSAPSTYAPSATSIPTHCNASFGNTGWRRAGRSGNITNNPPDDVIFPDDSSSDWFWYIAQGGFEYQIVYAIMENTETNQANLCYRVFLQDYYAWYVNSDTGLPDLLMGISDLLTFGESYYIEGRTSVRCFTFSMEDVASNRDIYIPIDAGGRSSISPNFCG